MKVSVKGNTYIILVVMILLVPYQWLLAWLAAAGFHEFCHYLAVRACKGEIIHLTVGVSGADMQTGPMPDWKRVICIICGPVLGLAPALLGQWLPRVAICSWLLSVYNLLPLLPLDGGRALYILLGERPVYLTIEAVVLCLIFLGALYAGISLNMGILPLVVAGLLLCRRRKSPCKRTACKVK